MPPKKSIKTVAPIAPEAGDDNVASRYKKVSHVDHILLRPEMYVGSIENHIANQWVFVKDAARTEVPDLLRYPKYDQKMTELGMNTVKLTKSKREVENASADENSIEESSEVEEFSEPDPVVMVNGVDSRLLASEDTKEAFPPGSQTVDKVVINPGLLKIVDEIIVNAADNRLVPSKVKQTYIKVTFDEETGEISVANDGAAIPVAMHPEHKVYVPEMIFGSLLTSSHYGNDPNSVAAGRHGFGAKLTNILSTQFKVECVKDGKRFVGTWSDNMKKKNSIRVDEQYKKYDGDFTKVTFVPEYDRFTRQDLAKKNEGSTDSILTDDFNIISELGKVLKRRLLDLSASIGSSVQVFYNDELVTPYDFAEYVRMHLPADGTPRQPFVQSTTPSSGSALACDFACVVVPPPTAGAHVHHQHHVSLVNGIVTHQGGTHLRHMTVALDEALHAAAALLEKEERLMLNIPLMKQCTTLIVNVLVHQSKFDSQSKDRLVSKHTYSPIKISDLTRHILLLPFVRKFCMTSDKMTAALEGALATNTGRLKNLMRLIPKLVEPADMTEKMHRTLILTEGDSAKALALNSLSSQQRQTFGVMPLRGKLLNVRMAHPRKVAANKEIVNVLSALGLSPKMKYTSADSLRYQRILIMTDQDIDGFHIRGLIISLINNYWPGLMKAVPDFVSIFSTPLIKVRSQGTTRAFYSVTDYKKWQQNQSQQVVDSAKVKYYKGLGTSSTEEGREYFNDMDSNTRYIKATDPAADTDLMDKAFGAGDENITWRKNWVLGNKLVEDMESGRDNLTIPEFLDQQLVQFALADNLRSFPDVRDGLRSSHRKIIWAMLNRKSSDSMRVSQCAGYVSECSNYHHGEASLINCIVGMAQTFVGSNNFPLLLGEGQFGSRIGVGSDAAAPRYIFTTISPIARKLFPVADDEVLAYEDQEGFVAEPNTYAPVVPTQFLNGCVGIGVGFAGKFLPHDVNSVIAAIQAMLDGESAAKAASLMKVGVTGFRGAIIEDPSKPSRNLVKGVVELYAVSRGSKDKEASQALKQHLLLRIVELPFGYGIEDYRKQISDKLDRDIVTIADHSGANHVDIRITVNTKTFFSQFPIISMDAILNKLNLINTASQFMVTVEDGKITNHYGDIEPQLERFYANRLEVYGKRLALTKKRLTKEVAKLEGHIAFSKLVKSKGSDLVKLSESELFATLKMADIPLIDDSYKTYLNRSFASLTKDSVASLESKLLDVQDSLKQAKTNTPESLWKNDLKDFGKAFSDYEKGYVASIAKEYKNTKDLGDILTFEALVEGCADLGYTTEEGWSALKKMLRAKKNKLRVAQISKAKKAAQHEATLRRIDAKIKVASDAVVIEEAKLKALLSKNHTTHDARNIKRSVGSARKAKDRLIKLKERVQDGIEKFIKRSSGEAAESDTPSAGAAGSVTGTAQVAAMIAPKAMQIFCAIPTMDAIKLAQLRLQTSMATSTAALSSNGMLRVFSRLLLK